MGIFMNDSIENTCKTDSSIRVIRQQTEKCTSLPSRIRNEIRQQIRKCTSLPS